VLDNLSGLSSTNYATAHDPSSLPPAVYNRACGSSSRGPAIIDRLMRADTAPNAIVGILRRAREDFSFRFPALLAAVQWIAYAVLFRGPATRGCFDTL